MYYTKQKNGTDNKEKESISEFEERNEATQSTHGEKRELSDNKEGPCWESFKSQSTQKSTQESSPMKLFSSQSSSQASSLQVRASSSQDYNKSDDEQDDEKISFYLKLGNNKKFKLM